MSAALYACGVCGSSQPADRLQLSSQPGVRIGRCDPCNATSAFRPLSGHELKAQGIAQVSLNAGQGTDAAWKIEARRVALDLARSRPFTANDITAEVGLPSSRNLVGAFLNGLAREGLIRRIGYEAGGRASQHARVVAVWEGR